MSECIESSCSHSSRDASFDAKPRHVRRLNFGKSILALDAPKQDSTSDRALVIDQNVVHIPCTEKRDYVRMWLETQGNDVASNDNLSQSSPVLGTSTDTSKKSPILVNSRKRPRKKIDINTHATVKKVDNVDSHDNAEHSTSCMLQSKLDYRNKEKNENQQECLSETHSTPSCADKITDETSPVLIHYKKRRKLQHESDDGISPKYLKLHNNKVTNANINPIIKLDNNHSILREMDYDKLEENADGKIKTVPFSSEVKESSEKHKQMFLSPIQELNFEDSSSNNTDKKIPNIEIDTSNDSKDDECNQLSNTQSSSSNNDECNELSNIQSSSSNNNLSDLIEDVDTQETVKTSQLSKPNKSLILSRQPFTFLQLTADHSDKTYCSGAETIQDENTPLSAKISQVPSFNKTTQKTDSKSNQTDAIISTITTPSKKSPDKSMYTQLLDSGKKRRKSKKSVTIISKYRENAVYTILHEFT